MTCDLMLCNRNNILNKFRILNDSYRSLKMNLLFDFESEFSFFDDISDIIL